MKLEMNNWITTMRPSVLSEVIGQDKAVKSIANHLSDKTLGQNIMLSGQTGTGKSTLGRIIAKALNCQSPNVDKVQEVEYFCGCNECEVCKAIDSSQSDSVFYYYMGADVNIDTLRSIKEMCNSYSLIPSKKKIIYIDEIQNIASGRKESIEALLNLIEDDYEGRVYFILATMNLQKIDSAIVDRCHNHYRLQPIKDYQLIEYTEEVFRKAGIKEGTHYPPSFGEVILLLSSWAEGSLRKYLKELEMCVHDEIFTEKEAMDYLAITSSQESAILLHLILKKETDKVIPALYQNKSIKDFFYYTFAILSDLFVYKYTGEVRYQWQKAEFEKMKNSPNMDEVVKLYSDVFERSISYFNENYFKIQLVKYLHTPAVRVRQRG